MTGKETEAQNGKATSLRQPSEIMANIGIRMVRFSES